jgi:hypothetical protein
VVAATTMNAPDILQTSVDRWNDTAIWLGVLAAVFAVFAGAAKYYQSRQAKRLAAVQASISKEKDDQLARDLEDKDLQIQAAKQRLAETELEIIEAQRKQTEASLAIERLRANVGWRHLDLSKFLAALRGQPQPTSVEIVYLKDDNESWNLAEEIFRALDEAKWPVNYPAPSQTNQAGIFSDVPTIAGGNAFGGITLVSSIPFGSLLSQNQNALSALVRAFSESVAGPISARQTIPEIGIAPPADAIRIVVGSRLDSAYPWRERHSTGGKSIKPEER